MSKKSFFLKLTPVWLFFSLSLPWLQLFFSNKISIDQFATRESIALLLVTALTIKYRAGMTAKWRRVIQISAITVFSVICNLEFFMFMCQYTSFNESFFLHLNFYEVYSGFPAFYRLAFIAMAYTGLAIAVSVIPLPPLPIKRVA